MADMKSGAYSSWGNYPRVEHSSVHKMYWTDQVKGIVDASPPQSLLAYGLGRSYGDSCLNQGRSLIDCSRLNRILAFDKKTGHLRCEAGTSLDEILKIGVPQGWFLPVTPGTKFVTVGGAIANDVHGKNHHRAGCFGNHVRSIRLLRSDCGPVTCSPQENADMFSATIAGLGLTGIILSAEIQLRPISSSQIESESIPFQSLDAFLQLSNESDQAFEYTVAWIDCFSNENLRGIFFRGNHAESGDLRPHREPGIAVPFVMPEALLNRLTVGLFNSAYYGWNSLRSRKARTHYDSFFYPLDAVRRWNLIYGRKGLLQYQFVLPPGNTSALSMILRTIREAGQGSFLAVLKRFGAIASPGILSFPRPGLTLALDFPVRGERTFRLMETLDRFVADAGGALYPAKDARMSPEMFKLSFPRWKEFQEYIDPKLSSSFIRRVVTE